MIHLEAIGEVSDPGSAGVGVGDDDDFMPTINEFLRF